MNEKGWSRTARYATALFLLIGFVWLLFAARILISPLIIAATLAYFLNPLVSFVNSRSKLPRSVVISLIYLISIGLLAWAVITLVPIVTEQIELISIQLADVGTQLTTTITEGIDIFGYQLNLDAVLFESGLTAQLVPSDQILSVISSTTTNLVWIFLILVTTYYLIQDWDRLRDWLIELAPQTYQSDVRRLYQEVKLVWQAYLRGQLLLSLLIGLITGVILAGLGLPSAWAIGLLAGFADFVPSVGPAVAAIAAGLFAWASGSSYLPLQDVWFAIVVVGVFVLVQVVENVWLRPRIMQRQLNLHPGVIIIAIIGAIALAGVLGGLLIIPVIGTVGVVGGYLRRRIFNLPPWPEDKLEFAQE